MNSDNQTQTLDDSTFASNPGAVSLSHAKLRVLRPDLYGLRGAIKSMLVSFRVLFPQLIYIEEQLQGGDSRAAVVVSIQPLLVAAYTDELDCIAMLKFPDTFVSQYNLSVGTRLLTVNCYGTSSVHDPDLILGPGLIERWSGFHSVIAEFLTEDYDRVEARKREIKEDEWQRAYDMGMDYLKHLPGVARDGRPVFPKKPAKL